MKKFDIEKYVENLYKNQNIDCCEDLKKEDFHKEYYNLIKEVLLILKDNKEKNINEIRNILYEKSNVHDSIKDFFINRKMAPGAVISYGTEYFQEIITIGNKEEVRLENNNFINNILPMKEDTIFDLASITKLFTSICILILIQNNKIKFDDKLVKFAPQFENIKDLTILELLTFEPLETDMKISNAKNKEEAEKILFSVKKKNVVKGERCYNDYASMVLKYVIESVSGLSYKDFLQREILDKYNMKNTYVNFKDNELNNIANNNYDYRIDKNYNYIIRTFINLGILSDEKARILGQSEGILSGHAGLFSNIHDLIKFTRALLEEKIINKELLYEIPKNRRGYKYIKSDGTIDYVNYYGLSVYCKNPNPNNSEVEHILSGKSFAIAGWTGTQLTIDLLNKINFILLSNRCHNRVTIIDKSINKDNISVKIDNKKMIVLSNGEKVIDSSRYAWDRGIIMNECIKLVIKYKMLEDIIGYKGRYTVKSRTI